MNLGTQEFSSDYPIVLRIKFPTGVRKILFSIWRKLDPSVFRVHEIVDNPIPFQSITHDFAVSRDNSFLDIGLYQWAAYALSGDGSRDTYGLFYEGDIDVVKKQISNVPLPLSEEKKDIII